MPQAHEIGQTLMLITGDFQRRLDADLSARGVEGIGYRHRAVILHLGRFGASRSVDLAKAAGIRPQSMMLIVRELEQMGMIQRQPDPRDSRAKLIDFTARGRQFIEELTHSTEIVWQQYREMLGEQPLTRIFEGLNELLRKTGEESRG